MFAGSAKKPSVVASHTLPAQPPRPTTVATAAPIQAKRPSTQTPQVTAAPVVVPNPTLPISVPASTTQPLENGKITGVLTDVVLIICIMVYCL